MKQIPRQVREERAESIFVWIAGMVVVWGLAYGLYLVFR